MIMMKRWAARPPPPRPASSPWLSLSLCTAQMKGEGQLSLKGGELLLETVPNGRKKMRTTSNSTYSAKDRPLLFLASNKRQFDMRGGSPKEAASLFPLFSHQSVHMGWISPRDPAGHTLYSEGGSPPKGYGMYFETTKSTLSFLLPLVPLLSSPSLRPLFKRVF